MKTHRTRVLEQMSQAIPKPRNVIEQDATIEAICGLLAASFLASEQMSIDLIERCANHVLKSLEDFADEVEAESN